MNNPYKNKGYNSENIKIGFLIFLISLFALLLPIKFGNPAALPEVSYFPFTLSSWIFFSWPATLFSLISGFLLLLSIVLLFNRKHKIYINVPSLISLSLWVTLFLTSLMGIIQSSCLDFAYLECLYLLGLATFAITIFRLLNLNIDKYQKWVIFAIITSSILIALYGIYQYHYGLDATKSYVITNILEKGGNMSTELKARLFDKNNLVFSTFAISNSFAAHLLLTFPLCLWYISKGSESRISKYILTATFAVILLYALFLTGSRASFLSLFCAGVLLIFILPFNKKIKFSLLITGSVILCLIILYLDRKGSLLATINVRLDYYQTALQMLFKDPIIGGGWGDFFHNYTFLKKLPNTEAPHMPHNFILSMGSQAGFLAFLSATAILVYPIVIISCRIYKTHNKQFYKQFSFPLLLGWTAWSIHSLLDVNIQIPATAATGIIITALMLLPNSDTSVKCDNYIPYTISFTTWNVIALILAITVIVLSFVRIPGDIALHKINSLCSPLKPNTMEFSKNKVPMKNITHSLKITTALIPYSPFPWAIAGSAARERNIWKLSEIYYKQAVIRSPKRASFHYYLAVAQFKLGEINQAILSLKVAKDLFPYKYTSIYLKIREKFKDIH